MCRIDRAFQILTTTAALALIGSPVIPQIGDHGIRLAISTAWADDDSERGDGGGHDGSDDSSSSDQGDGGDHGGGSDAGGGSGDSGDGGDGDSGGDGGDRGGDHEAMRDHDHERELQSRRDDWLGGHDGRSAQVESGHEDVMEELSVDEEHRLLEHGWTGGTPSGDDS